MKDETEHEHKQETSTVANTPPQQKNSWEDWLLKQGGTDSRYEEVRQMSVESRGLWNIYWGTHRKIDKKNVGQSQERGKCEGTETK